MKAMIFAAGLGTRLQPLTDALPKALVPVAGIPMIELLIRHLHANRIKEIIVNVHHFAEQIIEFLLSERFKELEISISNEENGLLDTGGGLKKAAFFFDDNQPFLVQNVDIMSGLDYAEMLGYHLGSGSLATLAVAKRQSSRYLLFDSGMNLRGWENIKTGHVKFVGSVETKLSRYAFSGIHIIGPAIFDLMKSDGKFSIIDTYLELAADCKITGFEHDPENWVDLGKADHFRKAEMLLAKFKNTGYGFCNR